MTSFQKVANYDVDSDNQQNERPAGQFTEEELLLGDDLELDEPLAAYDAGQDSPIDIDEFVEQELSGKEDWPVTRDGNDGLLPDASGSSEPSANQRIPAPQHTDGVFANMAAKPDVIQGKAYEEIEPPSYTDAVSDPSPPYFDTSITTGMTEDGEVLIDGMPVGDSLAFVVNVFVSMTFDFLGFLITSLLATSHAAKYGAQCGLGLTLIRVSVLIKDKTSITEDHDQYNAAYAVDPVEEKQRREWSAFLLMIIGLFICVRSLAEYIRASRMRDVIQASPASFPVVA
ncbi:hypothetical protein BATDEDRAFT_89747 [Batrachochytrium dendrobatidis JAM81]|uniref:Metal homeostatis protein bsd2 n=2 Tax=Batrachochytrium dendrobatidis TaxID=109871 RepID=F4P5W8_BATDJ|nr:uncharacterized protein BATDEDRAFT_89747 [Batrachochytrium dendrobatidis JAM81]EGF79499.1 hypothetical protein BATDEDRAFT_89747 [Batrachochytrium dendrobatidis JAM81]KAJ8322854.1 hypothetical protein O5D80_008382 [Batrachochytrium dendrobatidis]KAK5665829.1 hypothetical protein QVD99_007457 [Batrachochytrium dendrobatidis]OAJ42767.1 hypothetical protein BDEG_26181 [Batrachochytrium dendrobatidis JEL423]|eukprot:XP_006680179.1 hypothetical protein BATDEDRAFT_89747 [Batrachochytrium dendrobatidis JAM81]